MSLNRKFFHAYRDYSDLFFARIKIIGRIFKIERETHLEEKFIRPIDCCFYCRNRLFRNYAFLGVIH